jgi:cell division protein ZapD
MEFEQPLTEKMRTFLRIEFLYQQALFHIEDSTDFSARAAIGSLLDILTILGRGDVRSEVLKELERQAEILQRFRRQHGVDLARLQALLSNVEGLKAQLAEAGPHFLNPLKESEFLSAIKHRSAIPGGTCTFDLPDYGFWLRLPHSDRLTQFERWIAVLRPLCDAIAEALWLSRQSNEPVEHVAENGLYQHSLDRSESVNLMRILLPASSGVYPEISAGQHRFTIRFVRWQGIGLRPAQVEQSFRFLLALC